MRPAPANFDTQRDYSKPQHEQYSNNISRLLSPKLENEREDINGSCIQFTEPWFSNTRTPFAFLGPRVI